MTAASEDRDENATAGVSSFPKRMYVVNISTDTRMGTVEIMKVVMALMYPVFSSNNKLRSKR